jgi:hypothetical protein
MRFEGVTIQGTLLAFNRPIGKVLKDDVQQAVFVKIVELAEKSEQWRFAPVRSIVGLRSFYPDLRPGAKANQLPSGHLVD